MSIRAVTTFKINEPYSIGKGALRGIGIQTENQFNTVYKVYRYILNPFSQ